MRGKYKVTFRFAFISVLNGEQRTWLKGTSPPVQLDSAAPVPIERFNPLKVLCDLPMSYSSQQCLTYLVGIIIHDLVKGKWIKNRLNDLFNPAGSHSRGRGRTHSFVLAPHLLLSPFSCASYLVPVISQTKSCQIKTLPWFFFSIMFHLLNLLIWLAKHCKNYPLQKKTPGTIKKRESELEFWRLRTQGVNVSKYCGWCCERGW